MLGRMGRKVTLYESLTAKAAQVEEGAARLDYVDPKAATLIRQHVIKRWVDFAQSLPPEIGEYEVGYPPFLI